MAALCGQRAGLAQGGRDLAEGRATLLGLWAMPVLPMVHMAIMDDGTNEIAV